MWSIDHMSNHMSYFHRDITIHNIPMYDPHAKWDRLQHIVVIQSQKETTVTIGSPDSLILPGSPNTPS